MHAVTQPVALVPLMRSSAEARSMDRGLILYQVVSGISIRYRYGYRYNHVYEYAGINPGYRGYLYLWLWIYTLQPAPADGLQRLLFRLRYACKPCVLVCIDVPDTIHRITASGAIATCGAVGWVGAISSITTSRYCG